MAAPAKGSKYFEIILTSKIRVFTTLRDLYLLISSFHCVMRDETH